MATPFEVIAPFQLNTGGAGTGSQTTPLTLGLSNGNFLFLWQSNGSAADPSPNSDIVGKIFDAEGNLLRNSFQVNSLLTNGDESEPSVAATGDGGWIMAYQFKSGASSSIVWERYSASGVRTDSGVIAFESSPTIDLSDPSIAVNQTDGSFVVSFTRFDLNIATFNADVRAVRVDENGTAGPEFDAAQNTGDRDADADLAILSNGTYVSAFEETDAATNRLKFEIFTPAGTTVAATTVALTPANDISVTALKNGNFVLAWNRTDTDDILARVYRPNGFPESGLISVATGAALENEPDVVALPDGGFVIVWDNETTEQLLGRAYRANGTPDGPEVVIATDPKLIETSVTADGRLLITWQNGDNFEIFGALWDPRGGQIDNTVYRKPVTNFVVNDGPVIGSRLVDGMVGSNVGETMKGLAADDFIDGRGGNDTITGAGGNDEIDGGTGRDSLDGGIGNDVLNGEGGDDRIEGGAGNDLIDGGLGFDRIDGGIGRDSLDGGIGNDVLRGEGGDDRIEGGAGDDLIDGGSGNDEIDGGTGRDSLDGGIGNDVLNGEGGDDRIEGGAGNDLIDGGLGFDRIDGGIGFDSISGLGGFDTIYGEGGFDSINGNAGNDTIFGGGGNDTIDGGIGADAINGGIGFDVVTGKGGNDVIAGLDGFDTLYGNNGNDSILGNAGNDVIFGGLGNDTIDGGIGADTLSGDAGADLISGKAGFDVLFGGNGTDTLYGNAGNDTLNGGLGNDTLFGGIGSDDFIFNPTIGERDIIGDFVSGQDTVQIDVAPGASPSLQVVAAAGGVEATVLGHTIFFAGLSLGQLDASDFEFI